MVFFAPRKYQMLPLLPLLPFVFEVVAKVIGLNVLCLDLLREGIRNFSLEYKDIYIINIFIFFLLKIYK